MSTLAVVAEVLREVAPRALKARQIVELAGSRLPTSSKTPETVVSRDLALAVKERGKTSCFLRVGRGTFVLKEALTTALYNDNDGYAAAWTRNLIAAGQIAAGVVDERSIRDLMPADVASYRQCHFFSGIGVWSRALRDAGWPDDVSVWSGSCPCQGWSQAGRRQGFNDERHLWPEWFRLIAACRPAWIFGEQVSSKDGLAWLDAVRVDLEGADYTLRVLDIPAASCGAPHRRQRLYFAAYARERSAEILGGPWLRERNGAARNMADTRESGRTIISARGLHDRGQPGDDALGCCEADGGEARGHSGIGSDRGGGIGDDFGSEQLGDTGGSRSGRDAGKVYRAQAAGEGERLEARDFSDEPGTSGATHGGAARGKIGLVRGTTVVTWDGTVGFAGFHPGDRIRLSEDPSWGGAVRGYWAEDVEWIYCRPGPGYQDGCWRPTRAGIEPLADRAAPGVGGTRAKRLRCYGNAIVRPQAVVFISSVLDGLEDLALQVAPAVEDQVEAI